MTNFEVQLAAHPDRAKVDYLITGLRHGGFRLGFHSDKVKLRSAKANCPSANDHPEVIDKYLSNEIQAGRVFGPTKTPPFPYLHISRFGVIPKKNKPNSWHLILDLSFPFDHSVNDGIFKSEFPVSYSKVDDAIRLIVKTGKGTLMGKIDIKNAYRIIPIHPDDRYLLGMKWRDQYFVDLALPFGLRSPPGIFNTLADSYEWVLQNNYDIPDLLQYPDDFLTLGPAGLVSCSESLGSMQRAALDTGIPLAPEKCEGPTTCLVFLGIELDSEHMTARLPHDKAEELRVVIRAWAQKKWCTRKKLELLVWQT